ncbi:MAG: hypothetical protein WC455_11595 [Dehalococcoidia bacterium]|jgi:hypothetical protein
MQGEYWLKVVISAIGLLSFIASIVLSSMNMPSSAGYLIYIFLLFSLVSTTLLLCEGIEGIIKARKAIPDD